MELACMGYKALTKEDIDQIVAATKGHDPYDIVFALHEKSRGKRTLFSWKEYPWSGQKLCEAIVVAWKASQSAQPTISDKS